MVRPRIIKTGWPYSGTVRVGEFSLRREVREDGHFWLLDVAGIAHDIPVTPDSLPAFATAVGAWLSELNEIRDRKSPDS